MLVRLVDRIRQAKDRKIIIGCSSAEEINKIKEKLNQQHKHLSVEEIKNKEPLVVFKDAMSYNTNEDIIKAIKTQNKCLLEEVSEKDLILEVKCRKKTRN